MKLASVLVAAHLLCVPSLATQAQSPDPLATMRRLFDGMRAGDSAMVRSVFHAKARMISVSPRPGAEGVNVRVEESPDGFIRAVGAPHPAMWDERTRDEKVFIDGALASIWAEYSFSLGDKVSHCGIDHLLLTLENGAWKIIELSDTRRPCAK